jgi:CHAT domain-containing protein/tetratricopeptide (TPR) repeat protein
VSTPVWTVVDETERPDLLSSERARTALVTTQCPNCGQPTSVNRPIIVLREQAHHPPVIALADPPLPSQEAELANQLIQTLLDAERPTASGAVPVRRRWLPLILGRHVLSDADAAVPPLDELPMQAREPYLLFLQRVRDFRSVSRAHEGLAALLEVKTADDAVRLVEDFPELRTNVGVRAARDWLATGVPPDESPAPLEAILEFVERLERGGQVREAWEALSGRIGQTFSEGLMAEFNELMATIRSFPPGELDDAQLALVRRATTISSAAGLADAPAHLYRLGTAILQAAGPYGSAAIPEAIAVLEEARHRLPEETSLRGQILAHLGMAWFRNPVGDRRENVKRARAFMEDALALLEGSAHRSDRAIVERNLALVHLEPEEVNRDANLEEALRLATRSLGEARASGRPEDLAHAYSTLGMVHFRRASRDDPAAMTEARKAFSKALEHFDPGSSPNEWAHTQHNLGCTLLDAQHPTAEDLDTAIRHFNWALEVRVDSPVMRARTDRAVSLTALGRALEAKGSLQLADRTYQDALQLMTPMVWPAQYRETAARLAGVRSAMGKWTESVAVYQLAIDAAELLYRWRGQAEGRREELAESPRLWQHAGYALAKAGQPERAVEVLELGRARELGATVARDEADLGRLMQIDATTAERFVAARQELNHAEQGTHPTPTDEAAERLRAAATELDNVIETIRRIPGFERFLAGPSLSEIKATASTRPIVYIVIAPAGTCTLIVDRTEQHRKVDCVDTKDFTDQDLLAALIGDPTSRVPGGLLPSQDRRPAALDRALDAALKPAGRTIARPLALALRSREAEGATLIACGALGLIPLHAAAWEESGQEKCLMDDFLITYAPSSVVLAVAITRVHRLREKELRVVAVGNPQPATDPLPGAEAEVAWIQHVHGNNATTGVRATATTAFLRRHIGAATHVHLACHGRGDLIDPDRSSLALADGILTVASLREWGRLDARLVTLSACESGRFELLRTPDEVLGLPAGFLRAGGACVVASLWSVDDWPTALLMSRFYELLADDEDADQVDHPAIALSKAMQWLRALDRDTERRYLDERPALRARLEATLGIAGRTSRWLRRIMPTWQERPYDRPRIWAAFYVSGA